MWMYVFMLIQLAATLAAGLWFYRQLRGPRESAAAGGGFHARAEQERLNAMRRVSLSEPLSERARPARLSDIIGQEEGVRALRAVLCGSHPQHVILYGPPGVGKTCAARLMLEEAKRSPGTPFLPNAPFIEVDAACVRFDERAIADPLIGSVHDPIYQGAGPLGISGIPQPKEGAVTRAHGGVLFLDEIGEMQPIQMNKLLKVLEDRKVRLESAYYDPDDRKVPSYIHDIFRNGLPADFRLVAATTRQPEEIPAALRSRCMEVFFRALEPTETARIAAEAAHRLGYPITPEEARLVGDCAGSGRDAVNIVQMAAGAAQNEGRGEIVRADLEWVIEIAGLSPAVKRDIPGSVACGRVNGLAVYGPQQGAVLRVDAAALPGSGRIVVTGVVAEEEIGTGAGRAIRRRGSARDAAKNVATVLRGLGLSLEETDLHIDFPGGVPVDGPSAGVAMCAAAYSAIRHAPVDNRLAMTGELGVNGDVLPVGGVSRKLDAAERAGMTRAIIPRANWREIYASRRMRVIPVDDISDVLRIALSSCTSDVMPVQRSRPARGEAAAEGIPSAPAP